jgi:type I restriction enzyme S subunit
MSLVVSLEEIIGEERGLLSRHPSWPRVALGKVAEILNGFPFKSDGFNREIGFSIIRIRDLSTGRTETRYDGEVPKEFIVENGDLLIGMDGIFRCVEWSGGKAGLNQRVCRITPNSEFLNKRFLLYGVNGYLKAIEEVTSKVTVGHLSSKDILRIPFPIPPIEEQRRIVAKLEALLAKVDASRKRLERIPIILKRFRQAVLAAACDGRLTEDWRESAHKQDFAPPPLTNPRAVCDVEGITTTPDYWQWVPLAALCDPTRSICYGVIKLGPEMPDGIPCLRTSDVKPLFIDTSDVKRIDPEISGQYQRTVLHGEEVLVNVRGTLGGVAVVPPELRQWNISREVAVVPIKGVLPSFIAFWIASTASQNWLTGVAKGAAYTGINIEDLRLLPVPLPSISEQNEIVRRVSKFFGIANQIEARYAKAKAQVDRLTQSILAKAFRGELVPQDPNDEPADVLLGRLAAAPAEASTPARRRGRPPRVQPAAPPVVAVAPAEDREAPALADLTLDAILQAHRDVLASIPSPRDEDQHLRAMALRLGFRRLGSRIKAHLRFALLQEGIRLS